MREPPRLVTERLLLRPFDEGDLPAVFAIYADREANTFLPWFPAQTREEAAALLKRQTEQGMRWAICLREDDVPIGYIGLSDGPAHDLGYGLRFPFWHRGIATEAVCAVVDRLREHGPSFLTATHDARNPRSGAVMRKIGMRYCYSYREQWQPKDIPVVFRMYQCSLRGEQPEYQGYKDLFPWFVETDI